MNCPYCNKYIYGLTGLQELQKFQKHLGTCKQHPDRQTVVTPDGKIKTPQTPTTLLDALNIRADSGQ